MYKTAVYTHGNAVTNKSKTAKVMKSWYYSTARWQLVNVIEAISL